MFPLDKGITPRFNSTVTISSAPPSPREVRKKFTPGCCKKFGFKLLQEIQMFPLALFLQVVIVSSFLT